MTSTVTANATGPLGAIMAPMMKMKLRATQKQLFEDLRNTPKPDVVRGQEQGPHQSTGLITASPAAPDAGMTSVP